MVAEDTLVICRDGTKTRGRIGDTELADEDTATVVSKGIRRLPPSGGTVKLAEGRYEISDPVVIDRPVRFQGVGAGNTTNAQNMTMLVADEDIGGPVIHVTGDNAEEGYMHGTRIVDLGIVGPGTEGDGSDCLRFEPGDGVELGKVFAERLLVDSAPRHGVALQGGLKHVNIRDVWSGHHRGTAFSIEGGDRYWLTNCYGYDSAVGIDVGTGVRDVMLTAPFCRRHEGSGLRLRGRRIQVLGGHSINNEWAGVHLDGATHALVANGYYFDNTQQGILVDGGAEHTRLLGNAVGNFAGTDSEMRVTDGFKAVFEDGIDDVYQRAKSKGTDYLSQLVFGGGVDKSQKVGIEVADATGAMVGDTLFADNTETDLVDEGVRTLQQGLGRNCGDPREEGIWSGHGRPGLTVWDETDDRFYTYVAGEWRLLGI